MHPSQMSAFRKVIIGFILIGFTGALLVYTAMANLELLKSVYPDPQFYMFGLLSLEGGVAVWLGLFMLFLDGTRKGLCLIALVIDVLISGTGFFYEMEMKTHAVGTVSLPPVIIIIAFSVLFNGGMGILCKLLQPAIYPAPPPARVKESSYQEGYTGQPERDTDALPTQQGPGLLASMAANVIAIKESAQESAAEKRAARAAARKQQPAPAEQVQEGEPLKN